MKEAKEMKVYHLTEGFLILEKNKVQIAALTSDFNLR